MEKEKSPPTLQFASLYVGDLHPEVTEAILYDAFSAVGPVASCRVCRDNVTRRSLGYGYVNFHTVADAEKAIDQLNYSQIKGRACRIMWSQRDPKARKAGAGNVFVKNLDDSIDNKALHDTFSIFGNILSCKVATDALGKSRGYGFVHYESEEAAKQSIERVNGMVIGDKTVYVGPFLKRDELEKADGDGGFTNLYVKHLPEHWDDTAVTAIFEKYGEIASSVLMANSESRRFALVNYKDSESAQKAIAALHGKPLSDFAPDAKVDAEDTQKDAETKPEETQGEPKATTPLGSFFGAIGSFMSAKKTEEEEKKEEEKEDGKDDEEKKEETPAEDGEKPKDGEGQTLKDGDPEQFLYVQRAQSKAERQAELQNRFQRDGQTKGGRDGRGAPKQKEPPGVKLYIKNLKEDDDDSTLKKLFDEFGSISSASVKKDDAGQCKGVGFVVFSSAEDAAKAVAGMHQKDRDDKKLHVSIAEKKSQRKDRIEGRGNNNNNNGPGKGSAKGKARANAVPPGAPPPLGYSPFAAAPPLLPFGLPGSPAGLPPGMPGAPLAPGAKAPPPGGPLPPYPYHLGLFGLPPGVRGPPLGYPYGAIPGMAPGQPSLPGRPPVAPPLPPGAPPAPPGQMPPGVQLRPPMLQALGPDQHRPPVPLGQPRPLTASDLAAAPMAMQKQMLGERLYPAVAKYNGELAGKITGMMLELENSEILMILESDSQLKEKLDEAMKVLSTRK